MAPTAEPQLDENARVKQLVAEADTGGRTPRGWPALLIACVAVFWSLAQLWYASPLPFSLGWGVFNDTQARAIHLAFGLFLGYLAFPAFKRSPRDRIPPLDWALALLGAFAGGYLFWFYKELALRPNQPTPLDIATGVVGLLLLLEATRRAVGLPMALLAMVFLVYIFAGPLMPDVVAHKGGSIPRVISHMWLLTEGVYGIALGVSVSFIFVYVLFGALLDRAGAGNYMMQLSFALLGHLRGGPAKVSVVSSALNGLISGSSVSNVVSGGIFTIPLMKKAGYGGVKAGAIETMSSVDGQIMPPVMGAAAFLMVEYVGIPYSEIIKHAFLPAILSYIALFYIVHLEAVKLGMEPMVKGTARPLTQRLVRWGLGLSGTVAVCGALYYGIVGAKALFGAGAPWVIALGVAGMYVYACRVVARVPDMPPDIDVDNPVQPEMWATVKAGLHFLIPVGVLIWCLMVDDLSPSLAAFYAVITLIGLMLSQRVLIGLFRGGRDLREPFMAGMRETVLGLSDGARNMIGIAIATGCAGIIVGAITLTGLGLRMTDFVEFVSSGNVVVMLLFTALVCLVLGLGVPTTASYILVATLLAPVIVELGARSGLVIPLIAVHLFVFYYGIMADITPPVGLATFAAAAISGEDPIATGVQGFTYAMRTLILPFIWIYNPQLLMIDVTGWFQFVSVVSMSLVASLIFAAVTMGWFRVKTRWWETLILLLAVFTLYRPDFFMDELTPEYRSESPAKLFEVAGALPSRERLVLQIAGTNLEGDELRKTVAVQLGEKGDGTAADGRRRVQEAGLNLSLLGDRATVTNVRFGSAARKSGFEQGFEVAAVLVPSGRPSPHWFYLPALLMIGLVWFTQGLRMKRAQPAPAAA
ncbi:MAG TPA: TRAP transporter permease [Burkholderiaceae bacterium]|nr:TRAP transporter permease [Burkholderiaceae bacterium]HQR69855.1 TRAP transporter permease [Burkholderiaceae bacterium]